MTSNRQLCGQEKGSHAEGAAGTNAIRLGCIGICYRDRVNSVARREKGDGQGLALSDA